MIFSSCSVVSSLLYSIANSFNLVYPDSDSDSESATFNWAINEETISSLPLPKPPSIKVRTHQQHTHTPSWLSSATMVLAPTSFVTSVVCKMRIRASWFSFCSLATWSTVSSCADGVCFLSSSFFVALTAINSLKIDDTNWINQIQTRKGIQIDHHIPCVDLKHSEYVWAG